MSGLFVNIDSDGEKTYTEPHLDPVFEKRKTMKGKTEMLKGEKELFKELCSFRKENFNKKLLGYATPTVLGHVFYNRMQGIAFGTLKENGLLSEVDREFRNSLKDAYEQNLLRNRSFFRCVNYVSALLQGCPGKAAMLKGAWLCAHYPAGFRTSNDIDLLMLRKNAAVVGQILKKAGFRQGNIRSGAFVPADRKEIIASGMTRGETVPYIKEVDLPGMKYLEVDVNFSLDYKPGDESIIREMLDSADTVTEKNIKIPTLRKDDFLIHLCMHLYKEATTLPWIVMKRDMTLYKYADIYMLLGEMSDADILRWLERARKFGLEKICAFAILQTAALFCTERDFAVKAADEILKNDPEFLHTVAAPAEKERFHYRTKDIAERFFAVSRQDDLEREE